ncbi:MAG: condensation domain-containing protein, partial [Ilumatobacteraceae bacterium]
MTAPSRDDEPVTVRPRAVAEHPLSRTQRLIWSSQRLAPAVPLANMGKLHRFAGRIDAGRFVAAFDDVVRASDALRTIVLERPGAQPVARVLALPPAPTAVIDLPVDQLEDWCTARIAVPIDATACAYDSVLIRHHDDDWSWFLALHHVVTAAFGSALVFARGFLRSRAYPSTRGDDERARFWSSMVDDGPPISPYGPRGGRTTAVTRRPVPLHSDLMSGLAGPYRTISRELGLLGLAASAMAVLLHRSDGRADLTLGIPIHHRSGRDAQRVIGPMMELYPLRVRVASHESGRELFDRIHRDIISVLRTARPGESPDTAFDAVVNVLTARFGRLDEVPTTTTWLRSGHVDPAHALRVQVYDYGDGL